LALPISRGTPVLVTKDSLTTCINHGWELVALGNDYFKVENSLHRNERIGIWVLTQLLYRNTKIITL